MDEPAERVGQRRGLAVGLILTITLVAFENLGVATAMPVVVRDLGDLHLYGWAFTAALLASVIGITVAGPAVDRRGPARPFAAGLVLFAVGLAIAGTASSMSVLVVGRFIQGLGAGVVPPAGYGAIGRAFQDRARARMFALMSTAWVVPGLVGPALSGVVAEEVHWRWVFLGIVPLVPLTAGLALPALARLGPPPRAEPATPGAASGGARIARAVALAAGAGLVIAGLGWLSPAAVPLVVAGATVAVLQLRRLLPPGTLRAAPGVPAAVAARGLQTFAFFGAEAYVTLALVEVRGQRAAIAGLALTAATLAWTAGAWLQDRRGHRWGRRVLVARGYVLVALGLVVTTSVLLEAVPVAAAVAGWAIAGLGMGLSYGGLSLIVLEQAPPGGEGASAGALQLSDVLGMALGTGLGGAAVAIGEALGAPPLPGVAVAFGLGLVAALTACGVARRLPQSSEGEGEPRQSIGRRLRSSALVSSNSS
ncbi:MAG: MFS transporter [Actinobacteria bacterium]|nr:MFS transporter [Actinomycetota bacterium]